MTSEVFSLVVFLCCIDHTQSYGRATLVVTVCFSSETAVSLLMETSDNGCPNRTTLSNNTAITCLRLKFQHMKKIYSEQMVWNCISRQIITFAIHNSKLFLICINDSKPAKIRQFTGYMNISLGYPSNGNSLFERGYSVHISSSKEMVNSFPMSMF